MDQLPDINAEAIFLANERAKRAAKQEHHRQRVTSSNKERAGAREKVGRIQTAWKEDRLFKIWTMRCSGYSSDEIAEEFGMPVAAVSDAIWRAHEEHRKRLGEVIEVYRDMEITRSDMMLKRWLAISMMDSITIERIENGEPVARDSIEHPIKAAYVVLEIMKYRARLLGLNAADKGDKEQDPRELLEWLQKEVAAIQRVVADTPRDLLVLETETDIDGLSQTN